MRFQVSVAAALLLAFAVPVGAEATEDVPLRFSYTEGEDNIPPGCQSFQVLDAEDPEDPNPCHAIATSMNGLDSPKIDVLLVVPASPFVERDLRIMRQSIQMWENGIDWMAEDMGLDWLAEGIEFRIFTQVLNDPGMNDYVITDPEIVVVLSNPVGGIGIGIDPVDFVSQIGVGDGELMCHGIPPVPIESWQALPGFNGHHGSSGTYVEDCGGAGGNICFAINGAIDPAPSTLGDGSLPDPLPFGMYDLISHEVGHCLTLGHVGDGAEGDWAAVPTNDIMAYHADPPGVVKCVSSLNVEAFVVTMSHYIDTNGDDVVDEADHIWANDAVGDGDGTGRPFQIQHPDNHYYASPTREAADCPQPDFSEIPLSETLDFTPEAGPRLNLTLLDSWDGMVVGHGLAEITGKISSVGPGDHVKLYLNATNVTATIDENGYFSGMLDLGDEPAGNLTVEAVWYDADHNRVDSDRVQLIASPTAATSEATPGWTVLGALLLLGIAARRRPNGLI